MKWFVLVCLIVASISCGYGPWKKDNEEKPYRGSLDEIVQIETLYESLRPSTADSAGVLMGTCDSRIFTGLAVAYGAYNFDMNRYEKAPGYHWRHPVIDCYGTGESDSQCSRDGEYGQLHAWWTQRHDSQTLIKLEEKIAYLKEHNWLLCEGQLGATNALALAPLYLEMRERLGGPHEDPPPAALKLSESEDGVGVLRGFEAHLRLLRIRLKGRMAGAINDVDFGQLREMARDQPNNALFQAGYHLYGDGDQSDAIGLVYDQYPKDRLPTSADWCEPYKYQRAEDSSDWGPCPNEGKTHPAIELAVTIGAIRGE